MTRSRHSLAMQLGSLRHVIALHEKELPGATLEALNDLLATVSWMVRRETLLRDMDRLEKQRPDIYAVLTAFPGCDIKVKEPA